MSVFDRLLDDDPSSTREPRVSTQMALRELKQSVRRDLEWLLNTRRLVHDVAPTLTEVNRSVAVYGLPDLTATNIDSSAEQAKLVRAVEEAPRSSTRGSRIRKFTWNRRPRWSANSGSVSKPCSTSNPHRRRWSSTRCSRWAASISALRKDRNHLSPGPRRPGKRSCATSS